MRKKQNKKKNVEEGIGGRMKDNEDETKGEKGRRKRKKKYENEKNGLEVE